MMMMIIMHCGFRELSLVVQWRSVSFTTAGELLTHQVPAYRQLITPSSPSRDFYPILLYVIKSASVEKFCVFIILFTITGSSSNLVDTHQGVEPTTRWWLRCWLGTEDCWLVLEHRCYADCQDFSQCSKLADIWCWLLFFLKFITWLPEVCRSRFCKISRYTIQSPRMRAICD